ncbi:MAG: hypothetical protein COU33_04580, partial [Candidatus Magasanikbacteria bacterium CG10_big_fil_rev_8_21_14_0_10_43_6]
MLKLLGILLAGIIILLPQSVGAVTPLVPVVQLPQINFDLLNRVSCQIDASQISYRTGGENRLEFSGRYTTPDDMLAPIRIELFDQNGVLLYTEEGETPLFVEAFDPDNGANTIQFPNGDIVSRIDFPIHTRSKVTLKVMMNGIPCGGVTHTVVDPLTCAFHGKLTRVDDNTNVLEFAMNYTSPDDRRVQEQDIPYSLSVSYAGDIVERYEGNTFLIEDARSVAFHDGDIVASTQLHLNNQNKVYIYGSLGGRKCATAELSVVRPPINLPFNLSDILPGTLLDNPAEQIPVEQQDDNAAEVQNQDTGVEDEQEALEEPVIQDDVSVAAGSCRVVAEGIRDTDGNLYIATGLRYANLPVHQLTYQLIGYALSNETDTHIVSGPLQVDTGGTGFMQGSLFTFDPAGPNDTYVIQGLVKNLICEPAVFEAPKAVETTATARRLQDTQGNA